MPMQNQNEAARLRNQLESLAESARALSEAGKQEDAEKIFRQIAKVAPYHAESLNFLAFCELERKNFGASEVLLQKGLEGNPRDPILLENLGLAYVAQQKNAEALNCFNQVLNLSPGSLVAAVNRALLLEASGRHVDALAWCAEAAQLADKASANRALPFQEARTHLRASLNAAREMLRMEFRTRLDTVLEKVRDQYTDPERFGRLESAVRMLTGRAPFEYVHPLQRPSLFYYPSLSASPFHSTAAHPWVSRLESVIPDIRSELAAVLDDPNRLKPYVNVPAGQDPRQWRDLNLSSKWTALHLYKDGVRVDDNCAVCPKTAAYIDELVPLARLPGHAPEVFFSILKPGTRIPPHYGLGNYRLALHVPLILTADSALRVGNTLRTWEEGRCLIFDDSFQHEAWNDSPESRVVLIADIWHPELDTEEKLGIAAVIAAINDFRGKYGPPPDLHAAT
jgi:aspartate beta-hydroxylase